MTKELITTKAFWKATGVRAIKTFIQVILGVWTAGQIITEVNWKVTLISAVSAAAYSALTSICAGLPEVDYVEVDDDEENEN